MKSRDCESSLDGSAVEARDCESSLDGSPVKSRDCESVFGRELVDPKRYEKSVSK